MSPTFQVVIAAMGAVRVALGLAPFVAAKTTAAMLGYPPEHDTPTTRVMARLFGVRDVGLGLVAFFVDGVHPELLVPMAIFQALMDGGDLIALGIPLVRGDGIDRAAWRSAAFAGVGGLSWLLVLYFA